MAVGASEGVEGWSSPRKVKSNVESECQGLPWGARSLWAWHIPPALPLLQKPVAASKSNTARKPKKGKEFLGCWLPPGEDSIIGHSLEDDHSAPGPTECDGRGACAWVGALRPQTAPPGEPPCPSGEQLPSPAGSMLSILCGDAVSCGKLGSPPSRTLAL